MGTELCAPCELDPNFELLNEDYYDDDDGEQLDMDQVREGIEREAKFMESLNIGEAIERPGGRKVWGARGATARRATASGAGSSRSSPRMRRQATSWPAPRARRP
eukprot:2751480-Pyramimonas_sp.AAC.2